MFKWEEGEGGRGGRGGGRREDGEDGEEGGGRTGRTGRWGDGQGCFILKFLDFSKLYAAIVSADNSY